MEGYSYRDTKKGRVIVGTCELILHGGNIDSIGSSIINEYVERQGEIIDIVNTKLEEWNKKWDQCTNGEAIEEDSYSWYLYSQFIGAYERMVCINNNFKYMNSRVMMDAIFKEGIVKIIGIIDGNSSQYFEFLFPGEKEYGGSI